MAKVYHLVYRGTSEDMCLFHINYSVLAIRSHKLTHSTPHAFYLWFYAK